MSETLMGIEIGGTKLQVALGDGHGHVVERRRMPVDRAAGAAAIRGDLCRAIDELAEIARPEAIGVGFGGPCDWETGRVALSSHVEGWAGFELRDWLTERTGAPVRVDNDANAAALAEARRGAGSEYRFVFYTTLGTGMGGGMVLDGRLYHAAKPGEADVGLMIIDRNRRNAESFCSGWSVDRKVRAYVTEHPESRLAEQVDRAEGCEAKFLTPALEAGCPGAEEILNSTAESIAFALGCVTHLLHPEVCVLGGGLSLIGEPLRERVATHLPRFVTKSYQPGPEIVLAALGEDVVLVGALLLAKGELESL